MNPSEETTKVDETNPESVEELASDSPITPEPEPSPEPTPATDGEDDAKPAENEAATVNDEAQTALMRQWVEQIDSLMSLIPDAPVKDATKPQDIPKPGETPIQFLTPEQAEEVVADPSKLNDVLNEVRRRTLEEARQVALTQAQHVDVKKMGEDAQTAVDSLMANDAYKHLNEPKTREYMATVFTKLWQVTGGQKPLGDVMRATFQYTAARMQTHPHEFVKKPAATTDILTPPVPNKPVFAGGGGSARRTAPVKKEIDEFQKELDSLKPEHVFG